LITPLPHAGAVQLASQPSLFTRLPSSHCSGDVTMAFPQPVSVQLLSQPVAAYRVTVVAELSRGHDAVPAARRLAVGVAAVTAHDVAVVADLTAVRMLLPQPVAVQLPSQPSPFTRCRRRTLRGSEDSISTAGRRTIGVTAVAVHEVAVVARFAGSEDSISTAGRRTIGVAAVAVHEVAVVA